MDRTKNALEIIGQMIGDDPALRAEIEEAVRISRLADRLRLLIEVADGLNREKAAAILGAPSGDVAKAEDLLLDEIDSKLLRESMEGGPSTPADVVYRQLRL